MSAEPTTLLEALLAFQQRAPALQKDAVNPHFKNRYVSLDSLTQAITPVLTACGLVWSTMPCRDETGAPALHYELAHVPTREKLEGTMPLILSKEDMQGLGSAYSYGRRYAISAVLGLSAEDDDGNRASRLRRPPAPIEEPTVTNHSRLLTGEELNRMLEAIETSGQNAELLLAAVGLDAPDGITVEHARKIKALMKA